MYSGLRKITANECPTNEQHAYYWSTVYIMVICLIGAVHKYMINIFNMDTNGKRLSKGYEMSKKTKQQQPNVFLRLITKVHQPCKRVDVALDKNLTNAQI